MKWKGSLVSRIKMNYGKCSKIFNTKVANKMAYATMQIRQLLKELSDQCLSLIRVYTVCLSTMYFK